MSTGRHHSSVTQTQTVIVKVGTDEKKEGGGFGRFIFSAILPYVAVFFAAFGKMYRTTGARIAVGVYSILMAFLFVVMTITQGANAETVGAMVLVLIGAAVGVIAIIRASRDGKESQD